MAFSYCSSLTDVYYDGSKSGWIAITINKNGNEFLITGKGNHTESITGEYRITQASISDAFVSILKQTYTGQAITLKKDQITVKVKGKKLEPSQYEIVSGSYKNNVKRGTATVTIKGANYSGTRTVKFKIGAKGFLWWWRN